MQHAKQKVKGNAEKESNISNVEMLVALISARITQRRKDRLFSSRLLSDGSFAPEMAKVPWLRLKWKSQNSVFRPKV